MPHLFIWLPTHRNMVDAACTISIAGLLYRLGVNKIDVTLDGFDCADIAYSRNRAVARMLSNPTHTHLLFIDSDMVFKPELVAALIRANRDVVGYAYPARDGKRFVPSDIRNYEFKNGIAEVDVIGMGLCLIARSALERLIATGKVPAAQVLDDAPVGLFQQIVRDGQYHGEDESFCLRWRELCDGKVYALASTDIAHIGRVEFRASPDTQGGS
jgi:hypothetical protein